MKWKRKKNFLTKHSVHDTLFDFLNAHVTERFSIELSSPSQIMNISYMIYVSNLAVHSWWSIRYQIEASWWIYHKMIFLKDFKPVPSSWCSSLQFLVKVRVDAHSPELFTMSYFFIIFIFILTRPDICRKIPSPQF